MGKETRTLRPGQKAVAPRNTLHRCRNLTDVPATFLVEFRPDQPGFEKTVKVCYGLAEDGRDRRTEGTTKHLYHLALMLEWSESRLPGVLGLLEPVFRLLARRALQKGIDKELEETYCRRGGAP